MVGPLLYPVTEEPNELVPRLEIVTPNGTRLRVAGPAGLPGRLQRSRDLREWNDWQLVTCGGDSVDIGDPQASLVTAQFYRAVVP